MRGTRGFYVSKWTQENINLYVSSVVNYKALASRHQLPQQLSTLCPALSCQLLSNPTLHLSLVAGRNIEPSLDKKDPENATYFLFLLIGWVVYQWWWCVTSNQNFFFSIVVTAFLALFTCLGCCGAATKSGCMLGRWVIMMIMMKMMIMMIWWHQFVKRKKGLYNNFARNCF